MDDFGSRNAARTRITRMALMLSRLSNQSRYDDLISTSKLGILIIPYAGTDEMVVMTEILLECIFRSGFVILEYEANIERARYELTLYHSIFDRNTYGTEYPMYESRVNVQFLKDLYAHERLSVSKISTKPPILTFYGRDDRVQTIRVQLVTSVRCDKVQQHEQIRRLRLCRFTG